MNKVYISLKMFINSISVIGVANNVLENRVPSSAPVVGWSLRRKENVLKNTCVVFAGKRKHGWLLA